MENQNQHYGTHESMYVEDPNEQKQFLHSEEEEKPVVTGDLSETADDQHLNQDTRPAGMVDMDDLLDEVNDSTGGEPDPDEDEDDLDGDDPEPDDDDDDFGLDEDDPDDIDPDDDPDEDEDNVTYLK